MTMRSICLLALVVLLVTHVAFGQWTRIESGFHGASVHQLVVSSSGTLLAASREEVYLSADQAANWSQITAIPSLAWINAIAAVGNSFYVATNGAGNFRSTDAGATWTQIGDAATGALRQLTSHNGKAYGMRSNGELYVYNTSGNAWDAMVTGIAPTSTCLILRQNKYGQTSQRLAPTHTSTNPPDSPVLL